MIQPQNIDFNAKPMKTFWNEFFDNLMKSENKQALVEFQTKEEAEIWRNQAQCVATHRKIPVGTGVKVVDGIARVYILYKDSKTGKFNPRGKAFNKFENTAD